MAAGQVLVPAPASPASPFGLLAVAFVDNRSDARLALAGVQYEGTGCSPAYTSAAACPPPTPLAEGEEGEEPLVAFTDGREWVRSGAPFTIYAPHVCRTVGDTETARRDRAAETLRLRRGTAVERVLAAQLAAYPDAVDLTPAAGAVHVVDGIGILEDHARTVYGKVPTLHATPGLASAAATHGTIVRAGTRLETVLGSLVAAGAGYIGAEGPATPEDPDVPQPAGAGEEWLYITGVTGVWFGAPESREVYDQASVTNEVFAMAEQDAAVTVECFVAAVRVLRAYETPVGGA